MVSQPADPNSRDTGSTVLHAEKVASSSQKGRLKRLGIWLLMGVIASAAAYWTGLVNKAASVVGNTVQSWVQDYVTELVSQNLTGALTAGEIDLTPEHPQYTLFYYCPPGHSGKIFTETTQGYFAEEQRAAYVVNYGGEAKPGEPTANPGEPTPLKEQQIITISCPETHVQNLSSMDIEVSSDKSLLPEIGNLRGVTFILTGNNKRPSGIHVDFVAYVSPAIKMR
jgi:hypothetical protein